MAAPKLFSAETNFTLSHSPIRPCTHLADLKYARAGSPSQVTLAERPWAFLPGFPQAGDKWNRKALQLRSRCTREGCLEKAQEGPEGVDKTSQ